MLWRAFRAAWEAGWGAAQLLSSGYDFVRGLRKRIRRDTDPIPLVYKSSQPVNETLTERIPKPPRVPRI